MKRFNLNYCLRAKSRGTNGQINFEAEINIGLSSAWEKLFIQICKQICL